MQIGRRIWTMNPFTRHILVPSIAPMAVIGLYMTPVEVFRCLTRGLMALTVVLVQGWLPWSPRGSVCARVRALLPHSLLLE